MKTDLAHLKQLCRAAVLFTAQAGLLLLGAAAIISAKLIACWEALVFALEAVNTNIQLFVLSLQSFLFSFSFVFFLVFFSLFVCLF